MADVEKKEEVQAQPDPRAAMDAIRDLFATLDPPAEMEITNVYGTTLKVRNSVSARCQIRAMRELEKLVSLTSSPEMQDLASSAGSGIGGVVGFLVRAAMNEAVLDALCGAFAEAHPSVVEVARKDAAANGEANAAKLHVADLFPVEEVVGGLLPFLLRLIRKGVTVLSSLTQSPPSP